VQRRNRLSRSRDFDAVYRHGRSVSTRFLVLYWFAREDGDDPRLGIAVPRQLGGAVVRNRIKRQLRETWRSMLDRVPPGNDYVLIARAGLPEAAEAQGFDWLRERVDELLRKAAASSGLSAKRTGGGGLGEPGGSSSGSAERERQS
jgi:ribonuclease P protein component